MAPRKLRPVTTLLGHSSWSLRCAISGDGKTAISGDGVPSARVWDLEDPSKSRGFADDLPLGIRQCALSEDGSLAAVAAEGNGVSIHEVATGKQIYKLEEPTENKEQFSAGGCALTADGEMLVASFRTSNRRKGQIHILPWRNSDIEPKVYKRDYSIWQCEIGTDARRVAFKYWRGSKSGVELMDVRTGNIIGSWSGVSGEWNFAIDSGARMLATADSRALKVIDMATDEVKTMKSYTFSAFAGVDISSNGKHVVAPLSEYKFGIWETETGRLIALLGGHKNRSNGCAISDDGTRVITCSNDHTVRLWDTRGATSGVGADEIRESLRIMLSGDQRESFDSQLVIQATEECELGNAEELLLAHAALVIALRGAAARHDIDERTLVRQTAEKVYATIEGNLHDKQDVQLGQVVMAHAEQRGLLAPGLPTKHMGTYYKLNDKAINKLGENINTAWEDVVPLGKDDNLDEVLCKKLNSLYAEMHVGQEGVEDGVFGTIAACVLLFWTGNRQKIRVEEFQKQPRAIKNMLAISGTKDVAWIDTKMPFDISSPRVLRFLVKRGWIEKISSRRRHLIQKAVVKSKFQSMEKLELELTALIEKLARAKGKFQSVNEIDIEDSNEMAESDADSTLRKQKRSKRSSLQSLIKSGSGNGLFQSPATKRPDSSSASNISEELSEVEGENSTLKFPLGAAKGTNVALKDKPQSLPETKGFAQNTSLSALLQDEAEQLKSHILPESETVTRRDTVNTTNTEEPSLNSENPGKPKTESKPETVSKAIKEQCSSEDVVPAKSETVTRSDAVNTNITEEPSLDAEIPGKSETESRSDTVTTAIQEESSSEDLMPTKSETVTRSDTVNTTMTEELYLDVEIPDKSERESKSDAATTTIQDQSFSEDVMPAKPDTGSQRDAFNTTITEKSSLEHVLHTEPKTLSRKDTVSTFITEDSSSDGENPATPKTESRIRYESSLSNEVATKSEVLSPRDTIGANVTEEPSLDVDIRDNPKTEPRNDTVTTTIQEESSSDNLITTKSETVTRSDTLHANITEESSLEGNISDQTKTDSISETVTTTINEESLSEEVMPTKPESDSRKDSLNTNIREESSSEDMMTTRSETESLRDTVTTNIREESSLEDVMHTEPETVSRRDTVAPGITEHSSLDGEIAGTTETKSRSNSLTASIIEKSKSETVSRRDTFTTTITEESSLDDEIPATPETETRTTAVTTAVEDESSLKDAVPPKLVAISRRDTETSTITEESFLDDDIPAKSETELRTDTAAAAFTEKRTLEDTIRKKPETMSVSTTSTEEATLEEEFTKEGAKLETGVPEEETTKFPDLGSAEPKYLEQKPEEANTKVISIEETGYIAVPAPLTESASIENLNPEGETKELSPDHENKYVPTPELVPQEKTILEKTVYESLEELHLDETTNVVVHAMEVEQVNGTNIGKHVEKEAASIPMQFGKEKSAPQELKELDRKKTIKTYVPVDEEMTQMADVGADDEAEDGVSNENTDDKKMRGSLHGGDVILDMEAAASNKAEVKKGMTTKDLQRQKRNKNNMILGVAAIASFIICAALLTFVILKVR